MLTGHGATDQVVEQTALADEITVFVKRLRSEAKLPGYAYPGDSGLDLYSTDTIDIPPNEWRTIRFGIAIQLPPMTEAQIRPRSGLAQEYGVTILNSPCTIDNGYRGELRVILINHGRSSVAIRTGMRIAQLVVQPILRPAVAWADTIEESDRGILGFGSSGTT